MKDPRLVKLADLLVNYSVKVQPEEWVLINGHMAAEPLVSEVLRAVLQAGGHPQVLLHSDDIIEYNLRYAGEVQLQWISPATKMLYEQADVLIALRAFDNTRHMSGIDPKKQQLSAQAKQELMQIYMERSALGLFTVTSFLPLSQSTIFCCSSWILSHSATGSSLSQ